MSKRTTTQTKVSVAARAEPTPVPLPPNLKQCGIKPLTSTNHQVMWNAYKREEWYELAAYILTLLSVFDEMDQAEYTARIESISGTLKEIKGKKMVKRAEREAEFKKIHQDLSDTFNFQIFMLVYTECALQSAKIKAPRGKDSADVCIALVFHVYEEMTPGTTYRSIPDFLAWVRERMQSAQISSRSLKSREEVPPELLQALLAAEEARLSSKKNDLKNMLEMKESLPGTAGDNLDGIIKDLESEIVNATKKIDEYKSSISAAQASSEVPSEFEKSLYSFFDPNGPAPKMFADLAKRLDVDGILPSSGYTQDERTALCSVVIYATYLSITSNQDHDVIGYVKFISDTNIGKKALNASGSAIMTTTSGLISLNPKVASIASDLYKKAVGSAQTELFFKPPQNPITFIDEPAQWSVTPLYQYDLKLKFVRNGNAYILPAIFMVGDLTGNTLKAELTFAPGDLGFYDTATTAKFEAVGFTKLDEDKGYFSGLSAKLIIEGNDYAITNWETVAGAFRIVKFRDYLGSAYVLEYTLICKFGGTEEIDEIGYSIFSECIILSANIDGENGTAPYYEVLEDPPWYTFKGLDALDIKIQAPLSIVDGIFDFTGGTEPDRRWLYYRETSSVNYNLLENTVIKVSSNQIDRKVLEA